MLHHVPVQPWPLRVAPPHRDSKASHLDRLGVTLTKPNLRFKSRTRMRTDRRRRTEDHPASDDPTQAHRQMLVHHNLPGRSESVQVHSDIAGRCQRGFLLVYPTCGSSDSNLVR
jgi:hypothetical protein